MRSVQWLWRVAHAGALGQLVACAAQEPTTSQAVDTPVAASAPASASPDPRLNVASVTHSAGPPPHALATTDIAQPANGSAEATVVARLRWLPEGPGFHCGVLHVATVMQYEIVRVESGRVAGKNLFVAHGCAELPRAQYRQGAGTLTAFRVGELHRLVLTTSAPNDGPTLMPEPALPTFFCKQVDPAL